VTASSLARPENEILASLLANRLSREEAFMALYASYAPSVRSWLRVQVGTELAEDIAQEAWTILFRRWTKWELRPELLTSDAKPILSFLFRTSHFLISAERRRMRRFEQLSASAEGTFAPSNPELARESSALLERARQVADDTAFAVLIGKLIGLKGVEIADALHISTSEVDHKYRSLIIRIRKQLAPETR
jgi:DNA-directed RNA polymerase specialized sigma24 family protein